MKLFTKILIALLFICEVTLAQVNVVVNLPPVMPSELTQWRDNPSLVTVIFNNNGNTLTNLRIGYKIRDLSKNTNIITTRDGQLPSQIFNTGANVFPGQSLFSFPNVEINSEFYNTAATTNSLPEGQYEFCLYVLDAAGTLITLTGSQCAYFQVIIPQPVSLLQPVDNTTFQRQQGVSTYPMLLWTPAYTQGVPVNYRLRIVPVFQGQNQYDALNTNQPLVNKDITNNNYQYTPTDPSFELYSTAVKFAWQIRATNQFGNPVTANDGKSEVFCFAFNDNAPQNPLTVSGVVSGCESNAATITLTVAGGTAPYSYIWKLNNSQIAANTSNPSNLANGNYSVLVRDTNGDTVSARFTVNINTISFHPTSTPSSCGESTGSVKIGILSGGTPATGNKYDYELKRIAPDTASWRGTVTPILGGQTLKTGLKAGNYTLKITDSKGCYIIKTVNISDNNNGPEAYVSSPTGFCPGEGKIYFRSSLSPPYKVLKFTFSGPNGYSKAVTASRDSLTGLNAGTYSYSAKDTTTGCIKTGYIVVTIQDLSTVIIEKRVSNATDGMDDGEFYIKLRKNPVSIGLKHQDGTDYSANVNPLLDETTATVFVYNASGLKAGSYTMSLYYAADKKCERTVTFNVASCAADFTVTTDSSAYYYKTQTLKLTLNNVPNGNYTVKFLKGNGQLHQGPFTYNSTGAASITKNFTLKGNYTEGGYTVIVTHNGGCVATYQFIVYTTPRCIAGDWTSLAITPVQQRTEMWCWLTCGQMVFTHFGIPAPRTTSYQCHIISFYYPQCAANCGTCVVGANSAATLRDMITKYSKYRWNNAFQLDNDYVARALTMAQIKTEIDASRPVIAGICPSGNAKPVSEHVAVIIGYADGTLNNNGAGCFMVKVNDPYSYPRGKNPYLKAGGKQIANLQYEIEYDAFKTKLVWGESFYNFRKTALK